MPAARKPARKAPAKKPPAGRGKGTRAAGGKAAAKPAPSSSASRATKPRKRDRRLTPLERVERSKRITAARAKPRPDSWPTIALAEDLSERQCRRIFDDTLTWEGTRSDADRVVEHTLATIEAQMLELDDCIRDAADAGNVNARVGAIRLQMEAVAARWDVMRTTGRLPASWQHFNAQQDALSLISQFMDVLRGQVSAELLERLEALIDRRELPAGDVDGSITDADPVAA